MIFYNGLRLIESPEKKSHMHLPLNQILFICLFFVLTSLMSFYLGAKFGRQFLSFLNHDDLHAEESFLPDEKIYTEIKTILAENNQKFAFHQIVSENRTQIPVTSSAKQPEPLVGLQKSKPAVSTAPNLAANIQPEVVKLPVPAEKRPNVASVIAQELARDADSQSVSKVHEEAVTVPVVARPVGRYKLQVGSYADRDRALAAQQEWQSRGYAVELFETRIPGKGRWYRLHLGSFPSREEALSEQRRLLNTFHQTAMILAQ